MKERVIINNLTDSKPVRAVQLADGRWITEDLARSMDGATIITSLLTNPSYPGISFHTSSSIVTET